MDLFPLFHVRRVQPLDVDDDIEDKNEELQDGLCFAPADERVLKDGYIFLSLALKLLG
jgi:hypothetical protein